MKSFMKFLIIGVLLYANTAFASIIIPVFLTSGIGKTNIGTIQADDTNFGLMLTPKLHGLPPGLHGFHIHDLGTCGNHGMSAGGHLDPEHSDKHLGPFDSNGHLGDLPALYVDKHGKAINSVVAPRLKLETIKGHTIMIHQGGDNYADNPQLLGGGGMRIACGVIPNY